MKPYGLNHKDKPKKHWPRKCSWYDCYNDYCKCRKNQRKLKARKRKARAEGKKWTQEN